MRGGSTSSDGSSSDSPPLDPRKSSGQRSNSGPALERMVMPDLLPETPPLGGRHHHQGHFKPVASMDSQSVEEVG